MSSHLVIADETIDGTIVFNPDEISQQSSFGPASAGGKVYCNGTSNHDGIGVCSAIGPNTNADGREMQETVDSDQARLLDETGAFQMDLSAGGISTYSAAFLITNAALGAGLLNFPLAFYEAGGLVPGNIMHIFFIAATIGSLFMMALTASRYDSKTYQEMVRMQCGPAMGHFTSACIAVYCLITCVTFLIIVGDQTDRFFADYYGPTFCSCWWMNRLFTMSVAGLLVLALSFFKDMAKLVSMGYVGSVFMLYLVGVIVWVWAYGGYTPGKIVVFDKNQFSHMFDVLPTICFGYQCHVSSVPIYHSIQGRSKSKYFKACCLAMLCCAVVYTLSANFGYLTFGSNVADDLLLSYDNKHRGATAVSIAIIALALKSVATYPVLMFCVREALVSFYVLGRRLSPEEAAASEPRRRYVVVLALWAASLAAALSAANIDVVVRLLGSLAVFFIYILPGLCLFILCNEIEDAFFRFSFSTTTTSSSLCDAASLPRWSKRQRLFARAAAVFYIVIGAFTFALSLSLAAESAFSPSDGLPSAPLCMVESVEGRWWWGTRVRGDNGTVWTSLPHHHFGLVRHLQNTSFTRV